MDSPIMIHFTLVNYLLILGFNPDVTYYYIIFV